MLKCQYEEDSITFFDGEEQILVMEEKDTDNGILILLDGQLRSTLAHDILDELVAFATVGTNVTVDFGKVTHIVPSTMRLFLETQRKMEKMRRGTLVLCNLPDAIFREFEKIGMHDLLKII